MPARVSQLFSNPYFLEGLHGIAVLVGFYAISLVLLLTARRFIRFQTEVFRKTLHMVLLCSLLLGVYAFKTWWVSACVAVAFILLVYPALTVAETCIRSYHSALTQRKRGELKTSLVVVFGMFAVLVTVCWGLLGDKLLVLACVFAWGFGDAAAALVGKRFGRHALTGRYIEGRKSLEGTLAMFAVSFYTVLTVLLCRGGLYWYGYVPISVTTAAVCAVVELYTRNGMDTITCPFAAAAVLLPLVRVLGMA